MNLIVGDTYTGLLTEGICKGSTCLVTYLGRDVADRLNKFKVIEPVFFGEDPQWPEDDGWWLKDEVVMLGTDWWVFSPAGNLIEENE